VSVPILGVAAATAVIELARLVLWQPVPVPRSDQVFVFESHNLSLPVFESLEAAALSPLSLSAFGNLELPIRYGATARQLVRGAIVTSNYFDILKITPSKGNIAVTSLGASTIIISTRLWKDVVGGDVNVIGRPLNVGKGSFSIAAVLPDWFHGINVEYPVDVWLPAAAVPVEDPDSERWLRRPDVPWLTGIVRMKGRPTCDGAAAALGVAAAAARQTYPNWQPHFPASIEPLSVAAFAPEIRSALRQGALVVLVTAMFLVLMTALNTSTLELTKLQMRRVEYSIRSACGANSRQLVREAAARLLVVGLFCYGAGVVGAILLLGAIGEVRVASATSLSVQAIRWTGPATTGAWVTAGIVSIIAMVTVAAVRRPQLGALVRTGDGFGGGRLSCLGLRTIVVMQTACTFGLLAIALALVLNYWNASLLDIGFARDGVLIVPVDYRASGILSLQSSATRAAVTQHALVEPGVRVTAWAQTVPFGVFRFVDQVQVAPNRWEDVTSSHVSPSYFAAMGIRTVSGSPERLAKGGVALSESLAKRIWGTADALGRGVVISARDRVSVTAVVADTFGSGPDRPAEAMVYFPLGAEAQSLEYFIVRYDSDAAMPRPGRTADLAHGLVSGEVVTMNRLLSRVTARARMLAWTASLFGVVAVVLGASGVFALTTFVLRVRRKEFAIRLAVGASLFRVTCRAAVEALVFVGVGLLIGYPAVRSVFRSGLLDQTAVAPLAMPLAGFIVAIAVGLSILPPVLKLRFIELNRILTSDY
jgi:hypothetical protein